MFKITNDNNMKCYLICFVLLTLQGKVIDAQNYASIMCQGQMVVVVAILRYKHQVTKMVGTK